MGMQTFIKIYQKVHEIGPVSLFSEFEPRQNLDLSKIPFDNLIGYILSISMCMQNFITIFLTVLEIGPFSLFQNLELSKASTDKKCQFAISLAWACQYKCLRKSLSNYSTQFKCWGHFHFFRIWHSGQPRLMINVILQFLGIDLFNIKLSARFYQNIPNCLRANFHFFQNLNLGKTSTNPKCHLTISWAASCQYTNVYAKFHHNNPLSWRDRAIFTFSEFVARQNVDRWKMTFHNLLGKILMISMFKQKSIKIFHSVQEIRPFSLFQNLVLGKASTGDKSHFAIVLLFSEFEPRQKLIQSQMSFDNLMGYILSLSICMQNFITIFHSIQEIVPLSLFQNLVLGKASTNEKCHFAITWARSCQYQCLRNSLSNYST